MDVKASTDTISALCASLCIYYNIAVNNIDEMNKIKTNRMKN